MTNRDARGGVGEGSGGGKQAQRGSVEGMCAHCTESASFQLVGWKEQQRYPREFSSEAVAMTVWRRGGVMPGNGREAIEQARKVQ
jgi:hypothetical protein